MPRNYQRTIQQAIINNSNKSSSNSNDNDTNRDSIAVNTTALSRISHEVLNVTVVNTSISTVYIPVIGGQTTSGTLGITNVIRLFGNGKMRKLILTKDTGTAEILSVTVRRCPENRSPTDDVNFIDIGSSSGRYSAFTLITINLSEVVVAGDYINISIRDGYSGTSNIQVKLVAYMDA